MPSLTMLLTSALRQTHYFSLRWLQCNYRHTEFLLGPHGSGTRDINSSFFLNFANPETKNFWFLVLETRDLLVFLVRQWWLCDKINPSVPKPRSIRLDWLDDIFLFDKASGEEVDVTKSFIFWVAQRITMVGLARESFDGYVWPLALWTRSTRLIGVVDIYAAGRTRIKVFGSIVLPVLLCECGTWHLIITFRYSCYELPSKDQT